MSSRWAIGRKSKKRINTDPYYRRNKKNRLTCVQLQGDFVSENCEISDASSDTVTGESAVTLSESEEIKTSVIKDGVTGENVHPLNPKAAIREWALNNRITHHSLSELLKIIHSCYDSSVPTDARTLLHTPRTGYQPIEFKCGGQYYYFGLVNAVKHFLKCASEDNLFSTEMQSAIDIYMRINCDGIPLHHSSKKQFWPLLVQFSFKQNVFKYCKPDIISIFYGDSKPDNLSSYLENFIEEYKSVMESPGLEFNGKTFHLKLQYFVCDSPARSFLKGTVGHNGIKGCERCTQRGKKISAVVFLKTNSRRRTDQSFLQQTDELHHKCLSPLESLNIGMVTQFVLDPMHLVHLGVMRKLINLWMVGPLTVRLGLQQKKRISESLKSIVKFTPVEFNRKPRSLFDFGRYKATEFRTFLLYTGMVVLHKELPNKLYMNFLLLSISINLLSRDDITGAIAHARQYLLQFILGFEDIYGAKNLVYNVHNLCHIADDAERFGKLDSFSAYAFENYLGQLKSLLRKPDQALRQIINRISERKGTDKILTEFKKLELKGEHHDGPTMNLDGIQYTTVLCDLASFKIGESNGTFSVKEEIGIVQNIVRSDSQDICLIYKYFLRKENFFTYPVDSKDIGVYLLSSLSDDLKICFLNDVQFKYFLMPFSNNKFIGAPLL